MHNENEPTEIWTPTGIKVSKGDIVKVMGHPTWEFEVPFFADGGKMAFLSAVGSGWTTTCGIESITHNITRLVRNMEVVTGL